MSSSSPASRIQENLQELFQGNSTSGNPYIKFQLTPEITALLSMERVQETLIVEAGQITPLPSMPQSTIGIMNSRDRVFCVFDLAQLLNLPARSFTPRQYQIIVLQTTGSTSTNLGLIVNNIQGIMRLSPEQIDFPIEIASNLLTYTTGVVTLEENAIAILEFERIFEAITSG
jgi:twitching motility protein PilI